VASWPSGVWPPMDTVSWCENPSRPDAIAGDIWDSTLCIMFSQRHWNSSCAASEVIRPSARSFL